jgi:hypothetical protein
MSNIKCNYILDKSYISTNIFKKCGTSNIFKLNMTEDDKFKQLTVMVNNLMYDEPLILKFLQVIITQNTKQLKYFVNKFIASDFTDVELIEHNPITNRITFSYFTYMTLNINWNSCSLPHIFKILINDQVLDLFELHLPHLKYTYSRTKNTLYQINIDPNICVYIYDIYDKTTLVNLNKYNIEQMSEYICKLNGTKFDEIENIELKNIIMLPIMKYQSFINKNESYNDKKNTQLNWSNCLELYETEINQYGLVLGNPKIAYMVYPSVRTIVNEMDKIKLKHLTSTITDEFIMWITLNDEVLWFIQKL